MYCNRKLIITTSVFVLVMLCGPFYAGEAQESRKAPPIQAIRASVSSGASLMLASSTRTRFGQFKRSAVCDAE